MPLQQDECEHRAFSASQLKQALEAAQQEVASQVAAVSAADGAAAKLESQLEELKVQVKTSGQQVGVTWVSTLLGYAPGALAEQTHSIGSDAISYILCYQPSCNRLYA